MLITWAIIHEYDTNIMFSRVSLNISDFHEETCSFSVEINKIDEYARITSVDRVLYHLNAIEKSLKTLNHHEYRHSSSHFNNQVNHVNYNQNHIIKVHFKILKWKKLPIKCLKYIFKTGITWNNEVYEFLASKDPFEGAFFVLKPIKSDNPTDMSSKAMIIRQKLFQFNRLKHISLIASRMGLFFSNTCNGLSCIQCTDLHNIKDDIDMIDDDNIGITPAFNGISIEIIDDIHANSNNRSEHDYVSCMTDGSGFISLNLAEKLPYHVLQGLPHSNPTQVNDLDMIQPLKSCHIAAAYQVRLLSSSHGLFKGTLVINQRLPDNTIILRPSMKKADSSETTDFSNKKLDVFLLDIVNTSRSKAARLSSLQGSSGLSNYLNKHLILTLFACGVPQWVFENIIR